MHNLEDLKKKFLDGEISASGYMKLAADLSNKQEQPKDTIPAQNKQDTSLGAFVIIVILLIIIVVYISFFTPQKPYSDIETTNTTPSKPKSQIAKEDSINKIEIEKRRQEELIEIEKRRQEELLEESKFLKTKAGRLYKKHPEWSKQDCIDLANNKIWIGMTLSMLKYQRGLPDHANPSNYGSGTSWQWCWYDYTPSCFYDKDNDGLIDSYN
jgi:hypothetical protein